MNVAVIGASDKKDRYSYQAVMLLKEKGHQVFAVHPRLKEIEGLSVYSSLDVVPDKINTVSMYVASDISSQLKDILLKHKPHRVIFNPGAENLDLEKVLNQDNIQTLNACTLVLLKTNQF